MLGLGQLDAQTLAQLQMQQNFMQQQQQQSGGGAGANKHLFQNYSFDEQQLPSNYYDDGVNHRMNLLQQAQSHSFNMDMTSSISNNPAAEYAAAVAGKEFDRNNPRRSTLRRGQRVIDQSSEEINNNVGNLLSMGPAELSMLGLTPQQQQQLLMMRNQYSNNSSGQESGIGSSVYTNSAHGTHDLLVNQTPDAVRMNISPGAAAAVAAARHQQHQLPPASSSSSPHSQQHQQQLIHDMVTGRQLHVITTGQTAGNVATIANQASLDLAHISAMPPPLPRRKSLPSIVKSKSFKEDETAHSSAELNNKNQDMFIIENGIRKRVCEKTNSTLNQNRNETAPGTMTAANAGEPVEFSSGKEKAAGGVYHGYGYDDDETPQLPRKIVLESVNNLDLNANSNSKRVSMPSIPAYMNPKFANKGIQINKLTIITFSGSLFVWLSFFVFMFYFSPFCYCSLFAGLFFFYL